MSNIAGKAYAMNVITPVKWAWANRLIFSSVKPDSSGLDGLKTLSLIHYARWVVIGRDQFPHVDASQPKENLKFGYMLFESNFNGSWDQYVDSFTFAIPKGLDFFWWGNVRYPRSAPLTPFHQYIRYNQIETGHYYSAYPLATSNDVKSAQKLKAALIAFADDCADAPVEQFQREYNAMLRNLQNDLSAMRPAPIISMAAAQVEKRLRRDVRKATEHAAIEKMIAAGEAEAAGLSPCCKGDDRQDRQKETADE